MHEHSQNKILQWLRRMKNDGGGAVSLGHLDAAGQGVPLGRWPVREQDSPAVLELLSESVLSAAADDADGQSAGCPQQYVLLFYAADAPNRPASRLPFRLSQETERFAPEGSSLATEPATTQGQLAQQMRHNEFVMKHAWAAAGAVTSILERQVRMLNTQVERQQNKLFAMIEEREDLRDRDAERILDIERFEAERDFRNKVLSEGLTAAKGALALWANGSAPLQLPASTSTTVVPSAPAVNTPAPSAVPEPAAVPPTALVALSQIKDLMESFTPEQLMQLQAVLSPMQTMSFLSLAQLLQGEEGDEDPADVPADAAELVDAP